MTALIATTRQRAQDKKAQINAVLAKLIPTGYYTFALPPSRESDAAFYNMTNTLHTLRMDVTALFDAVAKLQAAALPLQTPITPLAPVSSPSKAEAGEVLPESGSRRFPTNSRAAASNSRRGARPPTINTRGFSIVRANLVYFGLPPYNFTRIGNLHLVPAPSTKVTHLPGKQADGQTSAPASLPGSHTRVLVLPPEHAIDIRYDSRLTAIDSAQSSLSQQAGRACYTSDHGYRVSSWACNTVHTPTSSFRCCLSKQFGTWLPARRSGDPW